MLLIGRSQMEETTLYDPGYMAFCKNVELRKASEGIKSLREE